MSGPLQGCVCPSTFHLISVRNAMASGVGITNEIMLIINILLGREIELLGIKA